MGCRDKFSIEANAYAIGRAQIVAILFTFFSIFRLPAMVSLYRRRAAQQPRALQARLKVISSE